MIFTMEILAVPSNDTKIQLIPLPEESLGMRLRYRINCHCFIRWLQWGIKMGARQTWIPLSSRRLKTEVFPPAILLTMIIKAEDCIWGATVTSSGCEVKHTCYKTACCIMREGDLLTCWYFKPRVYKTVCTTEAHHNTTQNQAHNRFITKPGCIAAFDDLLHLRKFSAAYINNYGQRIWNSDTVLKVLNVILPFTLHINSRISHLQSTSSVTKWTRLDQFDPNNFSTTSVRKVYPKVFLRVRNLNLCL